MKIALVSQEYPPASSGGIATQTLMKAKGLTALGHKVFVITRSIDDGRHENENENVVVIQISGMENLIEDMRDIVYWITYSTSVAAELENLNKREGLDIVDFPEWGAEGYIHLLNRYEWNCIPTVIQLHGPLIMFGKVMNWPDIHSEFYRVGTHMEATCVRLADAVYSSSECSADWIRSSYDETKNNIPVIHLGVDTSVFAPQKKESVRPTIIFVGKFVRNKGVGELVEAACHLTKDFPDLRLKMIGRGEDGLIESLKQKAIASGAPDLLEFDGYVYKDDLPNHLSQADIFAAPSHYEGGPGFVYLEAMACGLPVIGCSGSGLDEIISNGKNGFLIPPKDARTLESVLRNLLTDKILAKKIGANARQYALQEADHVKCLKKLEAFYYAVARSKVEVN
jgi:glycosyltransferase involved in cell wall biosynthesis